MNDRTVWVIGAPSENVYKSDPRYHTAHCYVPDQSGNRGRGWRVNIDYLPDAYRPCLHCGPGNRPNPSGFVLDPELPLEQQPKALRAFDASNPEHVSTILLHPGVEVLDPPTDAGQAHRLVSAIRARLFEDAYSDRSKCSPASRTNAPAEAGLATGDRFSVQDLNTGEIREYTLGAPGVTSPGKLSPTSPVGKALLGREVGETVEVPLPDGRLRRLRVITRESSPQHGT